MLSRSLAQMFKDVLHVLQESFTSDEISLRRLRRTSGGSILDGSLQ